VGRLTPVKVEEVKWEEITLDSPAYRHGHALLLDGCMMDWNVPIYQWGERKTWNPPPPPSDHERCLMCGEPLIGEHDPDCDVSVSEKIFFHLLSGTEYEGDERLRRNEDGTVTVLRPGDEGYEEGATSRT